MRKTFYHLGLESYHGPLSDGSVWQIRSLVVCRYVQTLERKTAGLQIVLASTKQRAAADRQALALLRREHSELQVHIYPLLMPVTAALCFVSPCWALS